MPAVMIHEMLAAEAAAKSNGWTEEQLLDLAGTRLGRAIGRFFPHPGTAVAYLGKGHNAGDAVVALAILRDEFGWQVGARISFPESEWAPLLHLKWQQSRLGPPLESAPMPTECRAPLLLIDGLIGIGGTPGLREPLATLAREMNRLRQTGGAAVAAVDLPSGIDPESGLPGETCVTADVTFMIANAKAGLLAGEAANLTGALAIVPVEILKSHGVGDLELIAPQTMDAGKAPRRFDFHKGMAGRVSIIAGSAAYTGAAVLAATGALRAGAGLITLLVPMGLADRILSRCPPEIIVREISSPAEAMGTPADALVIGCGLGELDPQTSIELMAAIASSTIPTVLDADALNLIARLGKCDILRPHHVITPHPGEFHRLAPDLAGLSREQAARTFREKFPSTLLLKGARTLVTRQGSPLWCNATGHPGMACGGQGDLLSGVIGALLAAGHAGLDAAALGAWLCGRASEVACWRGGNSAESLTPSDTAAFLGAAFLDWRRSYR